MFNTSTQTIEQLKDILVKLPENCFAKPCESLSKTSIGQHIRHVIELYQCLIKGYDSGVIEYDNRERNKRIEQERGFAIEMLQQIQDNLEKPDKLLKTVYLLNGSETIIDSNYNREVMYNLDHNIHHQALIKIGLKEVADLCVPDNFGVAPSTIQFKKECAQ